MNRNSIKNFFKGSSLVIIISIIGGAVGASLVVLVYNFTKKVISDLAFGTGILALATVILAAITALNVIRQNIETKRNRKERFRREILKWAIDVNNFALRNRPEAVRIIYRDREADFAQEMRHSLFDKYEPFRSKSVYIEELVSVMETELKEAVANLRKCLQDIIKALHIHIEQYDPKYKYDMSDLARLNSKIHTAAVEVIKKVATVDTKDL